MIESYNIYKLATSIAQPCVNLVLQLKQPCNYTNKVVQPCNSNTQGCYNLVFIKQGWGNLVFSIWAIMTTGKQRIPYPAIQQHAGKCSP